MGWFDRFVANLGNIAKDAADADAKILQAWRKYLDSVPEKEKIIHGSIIDVSQLKGILRTELVDLEEDEEAEIEVINDLISLSHEYRLRVAHRLTQTLDYAERKYEYVYSLVQQIHSIIKREFHLASALEKEGGDRAQLIGLFQKQIELELLIIKKINDLNERHDRNRFHELFMDLVRGEQAIKRLSEREQKLLQKMKARSERIDNSLLNRWGAKVLELLEERVHEAEAQGLLGYNPDMDFEFVNQSMFECLVKDVILSLRKKLPSEAAINAFVHDFREWFNNRGLKEE